MLMTLIYWAEGLIL